MPEKSSNFHAVDSTCDDNLSCSKLQRTFIKCSHACLIDFGNKNVEFSFILTFFFTVDDHFAKALGDTWIKLQKAEEEKRSKKSEDNTKPTVMASS